MIIEAKSTFSFLFDSVFSLYGACPQCSYNEYLSIKINMIRQKEILPFSAYQEKLCCDEIQQFIQFMLRNITFIVCHDTPSGSRQPYLRRVRNRRSFRDMNMNRLIIFICPEINSISAYGKNVRQFEYLPKQHICRASAHLTLRASRKTPFLHH